MECGGGLQSRSIKVCVFIYEAARGERGGSSVKISCVMNSRRVCSSTFPLRIFILLTHTREKKMSTRINTFDIWTMVDSISIV